MAKFIPNVGCGEIHGRVGDLVFRRCGGQTVVARRPRCGQKMPTPGQEAMRARFRLAAHYGKAVSHDPEKSAPYAARAARLGRTVYQVAMADYFHPPVVQAIDLARYGGEPGDRIVITATDDTLVVSVRVTICDRSGFPLERGNAVRGQAPDAWEYRAATQVPRAWIDHIEVSARDLAGNETTKRTALTCS